ncbi:MAG: type II secretion system inner membrane protein GspF [Gammaproteobacteria bacterium]|nr:type II secretion system inner membrane protein GspF [Gammaproteobacteria bacterium]
MAAFEYTALDQQGKENRGVLEGDAARQVRQQLRDKGLVPLTVTEVQQRQNRGQSKKFSFQRGINATDLALITRQFSTLVRSGLAVEEALFTVSKQTEKPRLSNMLMAVRSRVLEGHSLATALEDFPHIFSDLYRATVAAGEQSGFLYMVLERLADHTESRQVMQQKTQLAMVYPIIVTVVAILVIIALLTFVVPQVVKVFEHQDQQLPPLTVGLIAVSDFLRDHALLLIGGLTVVIVGTKSLLRKPGPKKQYHRLLLRLPLISKLVRGLNSARFARTFSILTASGVPALEGLRISAQVVSNQPMRTAVEQAARTVREGGSLHKALDESGYFPPMTVHLIASGEASGNLEEMLERAAVSQEREVETLIAKIVGLFEPAMILFMGVAVLIIVLAILLPIFEINQLIK